MELALQDKAQLLVSDSVSQDDPDMIIHEINNLEYLEDAVDGVKSYLYYSLNENWDHYSTSKSEGIMAYAERNGKHPNTVRKHIRIYKYKDQLPKALQEKPVRELGPIVAAMSQGYDLEPYYDDLESCNNDFDTRAILRKIKGDEPRKSGLIPELEEDGTLWGKRGGERERVGFLDVTSNHPIVQDLINRICNNNGVQRYDAE